MPLPIVERDLTRQELEVMLILEAIADPNRITRMQLRPLARRLVAALAQK